MTAWRYGVSTLVLKKIHSFAALIREMFFNARREVWYLHGHVISSFSSFCPGVCVVFLILAAGNMSSLVDLHVHGDLGKTGELRIWLVICFAVLLPCSWLGTPKEFWGIAVGASLATAVACLMICVCIGLDMPADLKNVPQPTVNFESFFSGMKKTQLVIFPLT